MENIKIIIEFLKGKKTFLIGGLMIALGLIQQDSQMIMEGLGFIFLRQGVAKMAK